jgi:hypothetical protein
VRRVAAAVLVGWEPVTLALAASGAITSLVDRGPASVAFLIVRVAITGLGMAAGARLWRAAEGGLLLARWAFGLQIAASVVAHTTRLWPSTLPPGIAGPAFALVVTWYAAWLVWAMLAARP